MSGVVRRTAGSSDLKKQEVNRFIMKGFGITEKAGDLVGKGISMK
jgi:hypothetical protein